MILLLLISGPFCDSDAAAVKSTKEAQSTGCAPFLWIAANFNPVPN